LIKKVQELEVVVVNLTNENTSLKENLAKAELSFSEVEQTLSMTTETHNKVRKESDDTSTTLRELEEEYLKSKNSWEAELSNLKSQKAKMSENSDEQVLLLDNKLEESTRNRVALRDELRKAREELLKEREELEAAQKKLLSKVERVTKSKQELEGIGTDIDQFNGRALPILRDNIRQHSRDLNPWANILEGDRSFHYQEVRIPSDDMNNKEFLAQMQILKGLVVLQNNHFEDLLADRKKEKQEVISVAMGKLKKREKTKQEKEIEAETGQAVDDSDDEPAVEKKSEALKVDLSASKDNDKTEKKKGGFVKASSPRSKEKK